jgi:hypothetical protein
VIRLNICLITVAELHALRNQVAFLTAQNARLTQMHADEEHRANDLEHQLFALQQQWENEKKQNLRMFVMIERERERERDCVCVCVCTLLTSNDLGSNVEAAAQHVAAALELIRNSADGGSPGATPLQVLELSNQLDSVWNE